MNYNWLKENMRFKSALSFLGELWDSEKKCWNFEFPGILEMVYASQTVKRCDETIIRPNTKIQTC